MLARILAAFWGGFGLLNLAGEFLRGGFDGNLWWVDLRPAGWVGRLILFLSGAALVAFAVRPPRSAWRRRATQALAGVLLVFALYNAGVYYWLLARGEIASAVPVPLSLAVAASLGWVLRAALRPAGSGPRRPSRRWRAWPLAAGGLAACMAAFALLQIALFGGTDYRRPADAIVVFGAGVTPEGRCSQALHDRVRTACLLHRDGFARRLVLSGGPTPGNVHETDAMKQLALSLGVPEEDITLDREGLTTRATVRNTADMLEKVGARRVLAVSQGYHLPRVKMTYQREGLEVYTVPAETTVPLQALPYYVAREIVAMWYYYFRPMG